MESIAMMGNGSARFFSKSINKQRIVTIGSGWAAMHLIQRLNSRKYDSVIVSSRDHFLFTPLLPSVVGASVPEDLTVRKVNRTTYPMPFRLTPAPNTFINSTVVDVNPLEKYVVCSDGNKVDYDKLVITVGAQPCTFNIPGVDKHAFFFKEEEDGLLLKEKVMKIKEAAEKEPEREFKICMVGAGPSGVELTAELSDLFADFKNIKLVLIEMAPCVLSMFHEDLRVDALENLKARNVEVLLKTAVCELKEDVVITKCEGEESTMPYDACVWTGGVMQRPLIHKLKERFGLPESRGGLPINGFMRIDGLEDVYAAGDCAASGLPPTAQVASQQGEFLAKLLNKHNGKEETEKGPLPEFEFNNRGIMSYVGGNKSVVEVMKKPFSGSFGNMLWAAIQTLNQGTIPSMIRLDW
eukprot:TRINITY_DN2161_c0_g1_i2.p1 TRINITY_DN2161_c0_g1~~TRINITY_DN2161_c0_g1_i2.p1  ORF type:complete len:410 (-),score=127.38 TRINITY_DN2161_c0_g1_i2:307-1536(-)